MTNTPSYQEIEDALRFSFSREKAKYVVNAMKATEAELREVKGILNMLNQCGDVEQSLREDVDAAVAA